MGFPPQLKVNVSPHEACRLVNSPHNQDLSYRVLGATARCGSYRVPISTQHVALTRATQAYYAQASALSLTATDFYQWLDSLPGTRWAEVLLGGFTTGQQPDFLRHCLERRGHRLSDFLAGQLSLSVFAQWVASGEHMPSGPP